MIYVKKNDVNLLARLARKYWGGNYYQDIMKEEKDILFAARWNIIKNINNYAPLRYGSGDIICNLIDEAVKRFGNKVSNEKIYTILKDFDINIKEE